VPTNAAPLGLGPPVFGLEPRTIAQKILCPYADGRRRFLPAARQGECSDKFPFWDSRDEYRTTEAAAVACGTYIPFVSACLQDADMNELSGLRKAHYSGCSTATHPLEGYCAIGDAYWQSAPTSGMVSRRSSRANRPSAGTRSGLGGVFFQCRSRRGGLSGCRSDGHVFRSLRVVRRTCRARTGRPGLDLQDKTHRTRSRAAGGLTGRR
jgi:hypothetical protein